MLKGYVNPIEVATFLGYNIEDTDLMADVNLMVEYAEACVDNFCDTQFDNEVGVAKDFDGSGTMMLTLGLYLRRLESVTVRASDGTYSELKGVVPQPTPLKTGGAYRWLETDAIASGENRFPAGRANIRVTGDWGFLPHQVPTNVRQAISYAVKHFFDMRMFNDLVELQSGLGRTIKHRPDMAEIHLPRAAKTLLTKWRNSNWMSD
jgi:hypothetical protein